YAKRSGINSDGTHGIRLHRFILNAPPSVEVDHVNGDSLDNRRGNLRYSTRAQNNRNRGRTRANKSGFKGVSRQRGGGGFRAQMTRDGVVYYLGKFSTAIDAALAYDAAARRLHGEFARTNFTESNE